jgi:hypothetical protein
MQARIGSLPRCALAHVFSFFAAAEGLLDIIEMGAYQFGELRELIATCGKVSRLTTGQLGP